MNKNLEIHGLRGLSIIAVLLYHLNPNLFTGGYLGVDIFFVISGFLISKMIFSKKRIDLKKFIHNRLTRIVPAYFFVLFIFLPIFVFLLTPESLTTYIKSNISSLFFLSNFFYLSEVNYYNPSIKFQNLLHTWSLSIEMQFYLLFALTIYLFSKLVTKKNLINYLLTLILFSFFFSIFCYYKYNNFNFFNLLSRLYEFLLGSIVFFAVYKKYYSVNIFSRKSQVLAILYYISILILFLSPIIMTSNFNYSFLNNLIICLSASIIIFVSIKLKNDYISLIKNRLFIFFGTISYSLYLIHYPIINIFKELQINSFVLIVFICIIFSYVSYYLIEKNDFIKKIKFDIFLKLLLIFLLLFVALNLYILKFPNKNYFHKYNISEIKNLKIIEKARENIGYEILKSKCKIFLDDQNFKKEIDVIECKKKSKYSILLIGDSHAIDIHNGLVQNDENFFLVTVADEGCRITSNCKKIKNINQFISNNSNIFDFVIYHQKSNDYTNNDFIIEDKIYLILNYLSQLNHPKVIWLGDRPHFNFDLNERIFVKDLKQQLNKAYKNYEINLNTETKIKIISEEIKNIKYISFKKILNNLNINYLLINNNITYSDGTHLSKYGEKFFVGKILSKIKK